MPPPQLVVEGGRDPAGAGGRAAGRAGTGMATRWPICSAGGQSPQYASRRLTHLNHDMALLHTGLLQRRTGAAALSCSGMACLPCCASLSGLTVGCDSCVCFSWWDASQRSSPESCLLSVAFRGTLFRRRQWQRAGPGRTAACRSSRSTRCARWRRTRTHPCHHLGKQPLHTSSEDYSPCWKTWWSLALA